MFSYKSDGDIPSCNVNVTVVFELHDVRTRKFDKDKGRKQKNYKQVGTLIADLKWQMTDKA